MEAIRSRVELVATCRAPSSSRWEGADQRLFPSLHARSANQCIRLSRMRLRPAAALSAGQQLAVFARAITGGPTEGVREGSRRLKPTLPRHLLDRHPLLGEARPCTRDAPIGGIFGQGTTGSRAENSEEMARRYAALAGELGHTGQRPGYLDAIFHQSQLPGAEAAARFRGSLRLSAKISSQLDPELNAQRYDHHR